MKGKIISTQWFRDGDNIPLIIRVEIRESTIPGAGYGVFAVDAIPSGIYSQYHGKRVKSHVASSIYSWQLNYEYLKVPTLDLHNTTSWYIDGSENIPENWARFVNCGNIPESNNLISMQRNYKIFYRAKRKILPGEELFIDYGREYRKTLNIQYPSKL